MATARLFAASGANDAAFGDAAWLDAGNITANDGLTAIAAIGGAASAPGVQLTQYCKGLFDFGTGDDVPSGATIDGIQVHVRANDVLGSGAVEFERVRLVIGGTIQATDKAASTAIDSTEAEYTFGGAADPWSGTPSDSDVRGATFGAVCSFEYVAGPFNESQTSVDSMEITVHYTESATATPDISVQGNSTLITNGDDTPDTADHTDFGQVSVGSFLDRTFTIFATGDTETHEDLTVADFEVTGTDADQFSVTDSPTMITPGASDTFTVRFTPTTTGEKSATMSFAHGADNTASPFTFAIAGEGPEVNAYLLSGRGARIARNHFTAAARGARPTYNAWTVAARGARRLRYAAYTLAARGLRAAYNPFRVEARGGRRMLLRWILAGRGARRSIYNAFALAGRGGRSIFGQFHTQSAGGLRRIANDSLSRYELYVGVGSLPDTDGEPDATSATLPIVHALDPDATYYLMTLRRNRHGLRWPIGPVRVITIGAGGALELEPPSAPTFTAVAIGAGQVRIRAEYLWREDEADNRADQWRLYATVGTDPVPGTDPPILTADHVRTFDAETIEHDEQFAAGQTVHVLARVRRESDEVESVNLTAVQVVVTDAGAGAEDETQFHGREHRTA